MTSIRLSSLLAISLLATFACTRNAVNPAGDPTDSTSIAIVPDSLHWELISVPQLNGYDVQSICFADSIHGVILGSDYNIYYSTDGGLNWNKSQAPYRPFFSAFFLDAGHGYAIGDGDFAITLDAGKTWKSRTSIPSSYAATYPNLQFVSPSTGYAYAGKELYRTSDTGATWKAVTSDLTNGCYFDKDGKGYAYVNPNALYTSADGLNWQTKSSIATAAPANQADIAHLQFTDDKHGWFMDLVFLNYTDDGGATWKIIQNSSDSGAAFYNIHMFDSKNGYWLTNTHLYKTTDGGASAILQKDAGFQRSMNGFSFPDPRHGWISTYGSEIIKGDVRTP